MTAIAIALLILLMFFWFTYNKSRIAFNKSVEANNRSILAMEALKVAYENDAKANKDTIKSISDLYESTAKDHVKTRILLLESKLPNLNGAGDLFYKIDDLNASLTDGLIDIFQYYATINELLDIEYIKIKT